MKNLVLLWLIFLWIPLFSQHTYDVDYALLEKTLEERPLYQAQKEHRIDRIKHLLHAAVTTERKLSLYRAVYDEYATYRFDSAMYYVNKMAQLARSVNNSYYLSLSQIVKSVLLTTSGYFSESIHNLDKIDAAAFSKPLKLEYYLAYEWAYRQWGEYSNYTVFAPKYKAFELAYQDSILSCLEKGSREYYFWTAERQYRNREYLKSERCYATVFSNCRVNERIYARNAYGLAMVNARLERWDRFEYYMMLAAISDQVCPLKENLALQELALFIYKNDEKDAAKANKYLVYSMEDAVFYGNRLRLLEISLKLPDIVRSYEKQKDTYNHRQQLYMWGIGLLLLMTIGLVVHVYRQMVHIRESHRKILRIYDELHEKNKLLVFTNHLQKST